MAYLSPRAMKNMENAAIRASRWWPLLSRTKHTLVLYRPSFGNRRTFAAYIASDFTQFTFDNKRNHWTAPMEIETYHQLRKAMPQMSFSRGVDAWVDGWVDELTDKQQPT